MTTLTIAGVPVASDDDISTATIYEATHDDATKWHGGVGFYWVDDEYPEDSGAIGPFDTFDLAKESAEKSGYVATASRRMKLVRPCSFCGRDVTLTFNEERGYRRGVCACGASCTSD